MRSTAWASSRALITVASTVSIGLLSAASASAHVRVESDNPAPGQTAVVTFRVPGESENGALTAAADEHPAPVAQSQATDSSARWLAGGALIVAAVAVVGALLSRRRS
jgi:uncharacterized protein YcnI